MANRKLGQSLGGAHHGTWPHGLVSRDEDEALDVAGDGHLSDVHRSQHVVLDGFLGRVLHQGNVFVGGGVEHVLRLVHGAQVQQLGGLTDVGDFGVQLQLRVFLAQPARQQVEGVLVHVHQHELARTIAGHLPRNLPADGAATAGHQNATATDHGLDLVGVELNLVARQQILGGEVMQHGRRHLFVQVAERRRDDLEADLEGAAES